MKKLIVFLAVLILMVTPVLAGSVSRSMPSRAQPGTTLTVTLAVSGATAGKLFTLEDVLPVGLVIKEWTVTGATEDKSAIGVRQKDNRFGWSFTPNSAGATVEYKIDLPGTETSYSFGRVVWFDPSGQGSESNTAALTVANIKCGDGICEGSENTDNCVQDCPEAVQQPAPQQQPAPPVIEESKPAISKNTIVWIVIAVIVIVAALGFIMWQKKKSQA